MDKGVIPKGLYCYEGDYVCPYWSRRDDLPRYENGYCAYLKKSDWDLNEEAQIKYYEKGGKRYYYDKPKNAHEIGLPMSLLWDMCKECGVKRSE